MGYDLQVKAVAEEMGLGFAGIGFQPKWSVAETPVMPKVEIHGLMGKKAEDELLSLSEPSCLMLLLLCLMIRYQ